MRYKNALVVMLFAVMLVTGCSGMFTTCTQQSMMPTPMQNEQPIIVSRQSYRMVEIWLSIMSKYPRSYFDQAKQQIADAIDNAVQPNSDGMLITINLISSDSFKPEATVLVIRIPALAADPEPPALAPRPTPTNDPFADAKTVKQIAAKNATTQQQYQQLLLEQHTHLAVVRSDIHRLTDQLRHLNSPVDSGIQDLWGAFGRAAKRFQRVQAKKLFLLVTSLDQTTWDQFTPDLYLPQVSASVIYAYCGQTQPVCEQSTAFWRGAFAHAGASSVSISDPAQSEALSLFA
jgi:hypothetical protein